MNRDELTRMLQNPIAWLDVISIPAFRSAAELERFKAALASALDERANNIASALMHERDDVRGRCAQLARKAIETFIETAKRVGADEVARSVEVLVDELPELIRRG